MLVLATNAGLTQGVKEKVNDISFSGHLSYTQNFIV